MENIVAEYKIMQIKTIHWVSNLNTINVYYDICSEIKFNVNVFIIKNWANHNALHLTKGYS